MIRWWAKGAGGNQCVAGVKLDGVRQVFLDVGGEFVLATGLDMCVGHALFSGERAVEQAGEFGVVADCDLALCRAVDETVVGGDDEPHIEATQRFDEAGKGHVELAKGMRDLRAAPAVSMRQTIDFRVVGIHVVRRLCCPQTIRGLSALIGDAVVGQGLGAARMPAIEGAAGDATGREDDTATVELLKQCRIRKQLGEQCVEFLRRG